MGAKAGEIWGWAQQGEGIRSQAILFGRGFLLVSEVTGEMERGRESSLCCEHLGRSLTSERLSPPVDVTMAIRVILKVKREHMHKENDYHQFS